MANVETNLRLKKSKSWDLCKGNPSDEDHQNYKPASVCAWSTVVHDARSCEIRWESHSRIQAKQVNTISNSIQEKLENDHIDTFLLEMLSRAL